MRSALWLFIGWGWCLSLGWAQTTPEYESVEALCPCKRLEDVMKSLEIAGLGWDSKFANPHILQNIWDKPAGEWEADLVMKNFWESVPDKAGSQETIDRISKLKKQAQGPFSDPSNPKYEETRLELVCEIARMWHRHYAKFPNAMPGKGPVMEQAKAFYRRHQHFADPPPITPPEQPAADSPEQVLVQSPDANKRVTQTPKTIPPSEPDVGVPPTSLFDKILPWVILIAFLLLLYLNRNKILQSTRAMAKNTQRRNRPDPELQKAKNQRETGHKALSLEGLFKKVENAFSMIGGLKEEAGEGKVPKLEEEVSNLRELIISNDQENQALRAEIQDLKRKQAQVESGFLQSQKFRDAIKLHLDDELHPQAEAQIPTVLLEQMVADQVARQFASQLQPQARPSDGITLEQAKLLNDLELQNITAQSIKDIQRNLRELSEQKSVGQAGKGWKEELQELTEKVNRMEGVTNTKGLQKPVVEIQSLLSKVNELESSAQAHSSQLQEIAHLKTQLTQVQQAVNSPAFRESQQEIHAQLGQLSSAITALETGRHSLESKVSESISGLQAQIKEFDDKALKALEAELESFKSKVNAAVPVAPDEALIQAQVANQVEQNMPKLKEDVLASISQEIDHFKSDSRAHIQQGLEAQRAEIEQTIQAKWEQKQAALAQEYEKKQEELNQEFQTELDQAKAFLEEKIKRKNRSVKDQFEDHAKRVDQAQLKTQGQMDSLSSEQRNIQHILAEMASAQSHETERLDMLGKDFRKLRDEGLPQMLEENQEIVMKGVERRLAKSSPSNSGKPRPISPSASSDANLKPAPPLMAGTQLYSAAPVNGVFLSKGIANRLDAGRHVFDLRVEGIKGEFAVVPDRGIIQRTAKMPDTFLFAGAEIRGEIDSRKRMEILRNGKVVKEGDNWRITQKAVIRFV
ncbi:hypothetical protein [Pontibacter sp. G13]|uniref:hypothetical protein n=1 Tax=Pontibacter sp. G13 TaxID=3074898 RepID=UPI00288A8BE6|nr:hypothetical protein [Pontibacter sp. G13]WNJ20048.1 hypothetical protein RJD25_06150 [Pontibacter sp. G13]